MATLGLDSPLLRWMMSGAQLEKNKIPVNSMGIGRQSTAQRQASGNKAIKAGGREAKALAAARGAVGKGKKKGKGRGDIPALPDTAVQLPIETSEEDLGLK